MDQNGREDGEEYGGEEGGETIVKIYYLKRYIFSIIMERMTLFSVSRECTIMMSPDS